jgi:hypothetical protein
MMMNVLLRIYYVPHTTIHYINFHPFSCHFIRRAVVRYHTGIHVAGYGAMLSNYVDRNYSLSVLLYHSTIN